MRILVIADPFVPVPPQAYGGAERIVDLMCRGLATRGHAVRLLAGPGSADYGGGLVVHRPPTAAYASRAFRKLWFQVLLARAAAGVDVVVNHGRLDYLELLYRTAKPVIHWFHTPLTGGEVDFVRRRRRHGDHFVGVSRSQVAGAAAAFHVIPNALDPAPLPFFTAPAEPAHLLFLGRLTRPKGVHLAIEAARRAGRRLVLAGNISAERGGPEFFEAEVRPHLGPDCTWVGPYDEAKRREVLAGAGALLFPGLGPEAFGLVMIEALASGVPVIALRRDAAPEIVADGRNGFLCDSVDDMVAAISRVGEISRPACRASVEEKFGAAGFVDRVEELVREVAAA